jgi:hypothetical protein
MFKFLTLAIFLATIGAAPLALASDNEIVNDISASEIAEAKAKIDAYNRENFKIHGTGLGTISNLLDVNVACANGNDDECYDRMNFLRNFLLDNPSVQMKLKKGLKKNIRQLWITERRSSKAGEILWFNPLEENAMQFLETESRGY